ncbi:hypothetical protein AB0G74_03130 [Streptomyces sp. NPDC020875]|uniref:hypothetical protein n=1 Tax=Streptomyces sp. NPDC020875 TaxID=3154898 RepID=UPI0033F3E1CB
MTLRRAEYIPFSELFGLPDQVGLRIAAEALEMSLSTAHRRIKNGTFPCPLHRRGRAYVIRLPDLLRRLGVQDVPVHDDDVEAGARFASGEPVI